MIPSERISRLKLNYSKGLFSDKEELLEELLEIIKEVERVKEHFETIIEEYDHQQPNDGRPYYGINMPKWSRDRARDTFNELKALYWKILSSE